MFCAIVGHYISIMIEDFMMSASRLHQAVRDKKPENIPALIEEKLSIYSPDENGNSPLSLAVEETDSSIRIQLLKALIVTENLKLDHLTEEELIGIAYMLLDMQIGHVASYSKLYQWVSRLAKPEPSLMIRIGLFEPDGVVKARLENFAVVRDYIEKFEKEEKQFLDQFDPMNDAVQSTKNLYRVCKKLSCSAEDDVTAQIRQKLQKKGPAALFTYAVCCHDELRKPSTKTMPVAWEKAYRILLIKRALYFYWCAYQEDYHGANIRRAIQELITPADFENAKEYSEQAKSLLRDLVSRLERNGYASSSPEDLAELKKTTMLIAPEFFSHPYKASFEWLHLIAPIKGKGNLSVIRSLADHYYDQACQDAKGNDTQDNKSLVLAYSYYVHLEILNKAIREKKAGDEFPIGEYRRWDLEQAIYKSNDRDLLALYLNAQYSFGYITAEELVEKTNGIESPVIKFIQGHLILQKRQANVPLEIITDKQKRTLETAEAEKLAWSLIEEAAASGVGVALKYLAFHDLKKGNWQEYLNKMNLSHEKHPEFSCFRHNRIVSLESYKRSVCKEGEKLRAVNLVLLDCYLRDALLDYQDVWVAMRMMQRVVDAAIECNLYTGIIQILKKLLSQTKVDTAEQKNIIKVFIQNIYHDLNHAAAKDPAVLMELSAMLDLHKAFIGKGWAAADHALISKLQIEKNPTMRVHLEVKKSEEKEIVHFQNNYSKSVNNWKEDVAQRLHIFSILHHAPSELQRAMAYYLKQIIESKQNPALNKSEYMIMFKALYHKLLDSIEKISKASTTTAQQQVCIKALNLEDSSNKHALPEFITGKDREFILVRAAEIRINFNASAALKLVM